LSVALHIIGGRYLQQLTHKKYYATIAPLMDAQMVDDVASFPEAAGTNFEKF